MRLVFSGLETPVDLEPGVVATLQVENATLFARLAQSLACPDGRLAPEPFTLWDGDAELRPSSKILLTESPLTLPWDDRSLMGEVVKRLEREFLEDEDLRLSIEALDGALSTKLLNLGLGMNSDYGFALEWDLKRYLKFRGFSTGVQESQSILDNLLNFLSLALDAGCKKVISFVNLKTFLTENDLKALFEYVFYSKLSVLLLENKPDGIMYDYERKIVIDLDFLES